MMHPPRRGGPRRPVALILLAIFLGSGTTLPSADALLFHRGEPAQTQHPHIEAAGGCASHVEGCILGRAAAGASAVLARALVVTIAQADAETGEPARTSRPPAPAWRTLPPSRAPPVTAG